MSGRPIVEVVTPEGPAVLLDIPVTLDARFDDGGWVMVEYPDGRRKLWAKDDLKPAPKP